jgi:hypothetical protein
MALIIWERNRDRISLSRSEKSGDFLLRAKTTGLSFSVVSHSEQYYKYVFCGKDKP